MTSDAELHPTVDRELSRRAVAHGNGVAPATRRELAQSRRASSTPQAAPRERLRRSTMTAFAVFAVAGLAFAYTAPLVATTPPAQAADLTPVSQYADSLPDAQSFLSASEAQVSLGRDDIVYSVYVTPKPTPTPTPEPKAETASAWKPPFVTPDPGSAQAIAYTMVQERGWGDDEFACLVALWNKESGWRVNAHNGGSGAYGIPQALPGSKMASAGADWETNPATQIAWGLGYIGGRYGTPCGAWGHSQAKGWY